MSASLDSLLVIDEMIEFAWRNAIKYRFDPVAGRIHSEYLEMLKDNKKELIEREKNVRDGLCGDNQVGFLPKLERD